MKLGYLSEKKNEITSLLYRKFKINDKQITCLNVKTKTFKFLKENIGEYHYDYDLEEKNFSDL